MDELQRMHTTLQFDDAVGHLGKAVKCLKRMHNVPINSYYRLEVGYIMDEITKMAHDIILTRDGILNNTEPKIIKTEKKKKR